MNVGTNDQDHINGGRECSRKLITNDQKEENITSKRTNNPVPKYSMNICMSHKSNGKPERVIPRPGDIGLINPGQCPGSFCFPLVQS